MAKQKKGETLFSETELGQDFEVFKTKWEEMPYAKKNPNIDVEKLWWSLLSWSDGKGERRVDWIAVARTFHLQNPRQYFTTGNVNQADAKIFNISNQVLTNLNKVSG